MKKRKTKKKFNLTNKEFKYIIDNYPDMFKDIKDNLYVTYTSTYLKKAFFFWKGKRVCKNDFYILSKDIE